MGSRNAPSVIMLVLVRAYLHAIQLCKYTGFSLSVLHMQYKSIYVDFSMIHEKPCKAIGPQALGEH